MQREPKPSQNARRCRSSRPYPNTGPPSVTGGALFSSVAVRSYCPAAHSVMASVSSRTRFSPIRDPWRNTTRPVYARRRHLLPRPMTAPERPAKAEYWRRSAPARSSVHMPRWRSTARSAPERRVAGQLRGWPVADQVNRKGEQAASSWQCTSSARCTRPRHPRRRDAAQPPAAPTAPSWSSGSRWPPARSPGSIHTDAALNVAQIQCSPWLRGHGVAPAR